MTEVSKKEIYETIFGDSGILKDVKVEDVWLFVEAFVAVLYVNL